MAPTDTDPIIKSIEFTQATPEGDVESRREYVSGGPSFTSANAARSLSWSIDDITDELGDDIYERMLLDPQTVAAVNVFKTAILEDGVNLVPAITDDKADGFDLAAELVPFCEAAISEMPSDISFDDTLWDLTTAIALGNRVAEQTYWLDATYTGKQKLLLQSIKVKPRKSIAFVVDNFWNVLGLLGAAPGQGAVARTGLIVDPTLVNLLPRSKFAILTFRPKNNDPRGTSILRPAYNAWWLKMQTWGEYLKYLAQFASPGIIGFTAPDAKTERGSGKSPEDAMFEALVQWRSGTAAAFKGGSKIEVIEMAGDGSAFREAFSLFDRQIVTAILNQTRATMEAEHGSKADSATSQDVLDTVIRQGKKSVARMIRRDILRNLVLYNYGAKAVPLTPHATLGSVEEQDWTKVGGTIASLYSVGYLAPSQLPATDQKLNLPARKETEAVGKQATEQKPPADDQQQDDAQEQEQE